MRCLRWIGLFFVCGFIVTACGEPEQAPEAELAQTVVPLVDDPLNAYYEIEGEAVRLVDGQADRETTPESSARVRTSVVGEPVVGDLDADGDDDVVLWLAHQTGGSGSFYYVAMARNVAGRFQGTTAGFVGDRIEPGDLAVRNGVVSARYFGRGSGDPLGVPPTLERVAHLTLTGRGLAPVLNLDPADEVLAGWLKIGPEVRSFEPCASASELWLMGQSPALDALTEAHEAASSGLGPYAPLFVTLAGRVVEPPQDGLGADYPDGLMATRLIQARVRGNCKSDRIIVESPLPGEVIRSPLAVRGWARGPWFFEGDAPVVLLDAGGSEVAVGYVVAIGEWMTQDFVQFEGTLEFASLPAGAGALVLRKDNPTDRPELDDSLEIPVSFVP